MTLVVDASAVVVALVDEGPEREWARHAMELEALAAPGHLYDEVSSALRRAVLGGRLGRDVAALAHAPGVGTAPERHSVRRGLRGARCAPPA